MPEAQRQCQKMGLLHRGRGPGLEHRGGGRPGGLQSSSCGPWGRCASPDGVGCATLQVHFRGLQTWSLPAPSKVSLVCETQASQSCGRVDLYGSGWGPSPRTMTQTARGVLRMQLDFMCRMSFPPVSGWRWVRQRGGPARCVLVEGLAWAGPGTPLRPCGRACRELGYHS